MNTIISREKLFGYLGTKERKKQTISWREEKSRKKENRKKEVGGVMCVEKGVTGLESVKGETIQGMSGVINVEKKDT